jgi:phage repressor protein C with HTH and peptisase S24 domain
MDTLAKRLKFARTTRGMTQEDLFKESGVKQSDISKMERGKSLKTANIVQLAKALQCRPDWLGTGDGEMEISLSSSNAATTSSSAGLTTGRVEINLENNPDYPAIRRVKFKLSAGASGFGVDYMGEDAAPIVFQRSWYEGRRLTPSKLFAIRVANGSMEPGLHDGDTVVVNTGADEPKDGVVYAVNYEGELVVKRLVRDEGSWWLSSDNPDQRRYPRKRMTEDCFVLGEIVHKQSERI